MLHVFDRTGPVEKEFVLAWHGRKGYKDAAGHPWTINEDAGLARSTSQGCRGWGGPFPYKVEALETEKPAKRQKVE